jgi:hypothetical protein
MSYPGETAVLVFMLSRVATLPQFGHQCSAFSAARPAYFAWLPSSSSMRSS